MSLRTDLATFLRARAAITAIVGARSYWLQAPQGATLPYITYQCVSGDPDQPLDGQSRLSKPVYQIDGFHSDPNAIDALYEAIRGLDGYVGAIGSTTCRHMCLLSERDISDPPFAAAGHSLPRVSLDFQIFIDETVT